MRRTRGPISRLSVLLLAGALIAGCDRSPGELDEDTLARGGDFYLQVDEAVEMLTPVEDLPNEEDVVRALADIWTDYVLLAWLVNREGELDRLDVSPLVKQVAEQELVMRLRDEVIHPDTAMTDEELRRIYEEDRPGEEVRARHVLLLFPDQATAEQRDSVWALAEEIRDRARAGEDFEGLAESYSDDPGSAGRGGDLSYFSRGTMVAPFEEVAFGLEAGEVSDVVETQFGLHVIRVEDRRRPEFEDIAVQLRREIQQERIEVAESLYVSELEDPADVRIEEDAYDLVRGLVGRAEEGLGRREGGRSLTRYEGGEYTVADFQGFLLGQPSQVRDQISGAPDEQIESMLRSLTRGELLVAEARRLGIELAPEEQAEMEAEIREEFRSAAEMMALDALEPDGEEDLQAVVDREVKALLGAIVRGERELIPMGNLIAPARHAYVTQVSDAGVERVVARVAELRGEAVPGTEQVPQDPGPEPLLEPEAPPGDPGDPPGTP